MNAKKLCNLAFYLHRYIGLAVGLVAIATQPAWAEATFDVIAKDKKFIAQDNVTPRVIKTIAIEVNRSDTGIEVVIETAGGATLKANTRTEGNTLIAEIPNAVLALPEEQFRLDKPLEGIANITATQKDATTTELRIVGETTVPTATVLPSRTGLVLGVTPAVEEELEIVVTGDEEGSRYRVPEASTATRTNTPIRDIPQAIQVIPKEVIEDRQVTRIEEALQNVSGVTFQGNDDSRGAGFSLRGFENAPILRDGFRLYEDYSNQGFPETANLEQIEVLKGPASVLYGEIQPGGVINLVSKKPLENPFYQAELQVGSREFIRPRIDISGPLTTDGNLLYRLNALYRHSGTFRDYDADAERFFAAPTLTWKMGDRTDLTIALEYINDSGFADFGTLAFGDGIADIPASRVTNNPDDTVTNTYLSVGYNFEHRFNDSWTLRNGFRYLYYDYNYSVLALPFDFDETTATVTRFFADQESASRFYTLQTNVEGKFATGSIEHNILLGIDLSRSENNVLTKLGDSDPLNIFNPIYDQPEPDAETLPVFSDETNESNRLGVYLQDRVAFLDNLFLLVGLRYDTIDQKIITGPTADEEVGSEQDRTEDAFTPRIGIVYQPIEAVSLYASYSRSFNPNTSTTASGDFLEPEEGEGYEVGVKTEWLDGKLSATLAYFDITKQNVAVSDPAFPGLNFFIATGEQRSRGIELDAIGEILPGWNIIASYAYIDAEVTEDTDPDLVGSKLPGIPQHSASLWTTYEIQRGDLRGLGFGIGFNYVGEREGGLPNSFQADGYFLTNAAIFYQRDNWRFALNFKNLFDVDYIEAVRNDRVRGIYSGEPFVVLGSVSVQF
jgi:iron complex outermembrane recepter protein